MKRSAAMVAIVVGAGACSDGELPGPVAPEFAVTASAGSGNPVVESVTGSGQITDPPSGEWRNFAFTARRYADATVQGEWQRFNRRPGSVASHGNITCFTVVGNQAWFGGFTEHGAPLGGNGWRVVDNGEGNNDPRDQISLEFVGGGPGFAAAYCAATPASPALNDVEAGNIQIH